VAGRRVLGNRGGSVGGGPWTPKRGILDEELGRNNCLWERGHDKKRGERQKEREKKNLRKKGNLL